MELTGLICDLSLCRLCGEENTNGTELFPTQQNEQDLSELINKYLPLKIDNDKKYPTKICPGCNIQLEATKSFMDLIVEGQNKLRNLYKAQQDKLHRQEKQRLQLEEALKSVNPSSSIDTYTIQSDETGEKFVIQIFSPGPLFPPDHELSLRVEGLTKPRRKRGRPPKPPQSSEPETPINIQESEKNDESVNASLDETVEDGKRRRRIKVPTRYLEAIQGKELDKVLKQEGVVDEELFSDVDDPQIEEPETSKIEEVIGRMENENGEDLGQPVVINRALHKTKAKTKTISNSQSKKRRKYQCEICGREFMHHGRYEVHKRMHEVVYTCGHEDCNFTTDKKSLLKQHQADHEHTIFTATEKIDQYGTLQLPAKIKTDEVLETSDEVVEEEKSPALNKSDFFCEKCNKNFTCRQNYEVHLKAVHAGERPFICQHCDKSFSYSSSLKIHLIRHNNKTKDDSEANGQYKCPSCPKTFRHPSSLQYHRDSVHTNGRRFVCNKCDKPFKHRQLLQRHQLVHTDERPHRCPQCHSAFKTRANLIHHTRTVHAGQRSHWCSQCGKSFAHKTALKLHQRWHSGVRPYQCEFCQKSFSQKGNLSEHRRIHTGEKPYQCDNCGRAFTTSSQFRLHRKRHLDERPHKCEYCHKSFLHKVTLKCHLRRHLDDKPFKCQHCPKSFPEAWALKKHERLHTGEKPYECDQCMKPFADSSNLAKHRRTHRNFKDNINKKQMLYVTYEKDMTEAIVTYIEPQADSLPDASELVAEDVKTVQLQQLVDQDGNPISFTTQDGQQVKVVTSTENGQENIQGLLPDGTLVPISLVQDKGKSGSNSLEELEEITFEGQLLSNDIHFLSENDGSKVQGTTPFITEDNQNMCLVTTYNLEDSINPQYLTMTE